MSEVEEQAFLQQAVESGLESGPEAPHSTRRSNPNGPLIWIIAVLILIIIALSAMLVIVMTGDENNETQPSLEAAKPYPKAGQPNIIL